MGAAMSAAGLSAGGFGSGFVEPMGEDCLGMRRSPAVGQHLFELRVFCVKSQQEIMDVGPGFDGQGVLKAQGQFDALVDRRPAIAEGYEALGGGGHIILQQVFHIVQTRLQTALQALRGRHGSAEGYARDLGVSHSTISGLRARLLA
mgnify:CR=1 FL=1